MLRRRTKVPLIVLEAFDGLGALGGSIALVVSPTKLMGMQTAWLQGSPSCDYTVPAVVLLAGVGGSNLLAAGLLLKGRAQDGLLAAVAAGAILVGFELVELAVIGYQLFLQPLTLATGLLTLVLALHAIRLNRRVGMYQKQFGQPR